MSLPAFVCRSPAWAVLSAETVLKYTTWRQQVAMAHGRTVNGRLPLKALARDVVVLEACGFIAKTSPVRAGACGAPTATYRFTDLPFCEPEDPAGRMYPPSPAFMGHRYEGDARRAIREALQHSKRQRERFKATEVAKA